MDALKLVLHIEIPSANVEDIPGLIADVYPDIAPTPAEVADLITVDQWRRQVGVVVSDHDGDVVALVGTIVGAEVGEA